MKKYIWFILFVIIFVVIRYFFYQEYLVYKYKSCVRNGGEIGMIGESVYCKMNNKMYYPRANRGMTD